MAVAGPCAHSFKMIKSDSTLIQWTCNLCHSGPHWSIFECRYSPQTTDCGKDGAHREGTQDGGMPATWGFGIGCTRGMFTKTHCCSPRASHLVRNPATC
ncbi:hypothetical protein CABS01_04706 [Colletotrichum abscissum]|uniref:Uncharacterized protein n=2 Tax=Colletotrichum acutatum species complex TaxID=2707335 RepID=A0AAJ0DXZ0_9PEZI|nr:uncharacterized protein CCOS01_09688 [Colletotrichum costaricense]XP_060386083.1 uncharacterized protein CTAM01_03046 [Colletotrichum tamarilloi]XP_060389738.1 uncharacterized protein CABS01_04706 [Colletotrichum abscissum]KAK1472063.1 hypothetical protein CABS01_04706 [Colletotrichum abscissum]KAK1506714.1 hypothetical protein CTAM01_03046 [Colletotrichum tamarilloi]KAK1521976.1 hypothetical protein CCOS01_09688 [Colletotrichum costaricense]